MNFNIIEFLTLSNKILAAIMLATGLIMFLPDVLINKLSLDTFKMNYGFIVGVAFLISFSILFIELLIKGYTWGSNKLVDKRVKKNSEKALIALDIYQKAIVYSLYVKENHTLELPISDGITKYLEYKMIITKAATQHFISDLSNPKFPYMLQPWVIEKLKNDRELIKLFESELQENEAEIETFLEEVFTDEYY